MNTNKTYNQLNKEFIEVEDEISQLSLRLEGLYAKRGELREALHEASKKSGRR